MAAEPLNDMLTVHAVVMVMVLVNVAANSFGADCTLVSNLCKLIINSCY